MRRKFVVSNKSCQVAGLLGRWNAKLPSTKRAQQPGNLATWKMNIELVDYRPEWQPHFERLNKAWLEEYFTVEPIDEWVLANPEAAILHDGGRIIFAREHDTGAIVGVVALRWLEPDVLELTKMAVEKSLRGHGIGQMLCAGAVRRARELGAHKLLLYSQTGLAPAIAIYRKLGFTEIPLGHGTYARADIKMELSLEPVLAENDRQCYLK